MTTDGVNNAENGDRERPTRDTQRRGNDPPLSIDGAMEKTMMRAADHRPDSES